MSTAKFNTWLNPDGTQNYKCRAWVNFNGTGTVAIRAAGNVTSITDNGTGDYTVNFTTAMPDANYAVTHALSTTGANYHILVVESISTTSLRVSTCYVSNLGGDRIRQDSPINGIAIFR